MNKYNRTLVLAAGAIAAVSTLPVSSLAMRRRPQAIRSHFPNRGATSPTCQAGTA